MKCPICQNETFNEKDYEYDICKECFWEYDILQVKHPNYAGGANNYSLNEYKKLYEELKLRNPNFSCKNHNDRELITKLVNNINNKS